MDHGVRDRVLMLTCIDSIRGRGVAAACGKEEPSYACRSPTTRYSRETISALEDVRFVHRGLRNDAARMAGRRHRIY